MNEYRHLEELVNKTQQDLTIAYDHTSYSNLISQARERDTLYNREDGEVGIGFPNDIQIKIIAMDPNPKYQRCDYFFVAA